MPVIDTHIHIWDFQKARYSWLEEDTSLLNRTYAIEQLEPERVAANVSSGLLVQAANNEEDTQWMLEVTSQTNWLVGVIGWLPLTDTNACIQQWETTYKHNQYFKGVRHLMHDEPANDWPLQPAILETFSWMAANDIPYDIVATNTEHIEAALTVAEKIPGLRMMFDHLSQPPSAAGKDDRRWSELMKVAAGHRNFYAKISGLGLTTGKGNNWKASDIEPAVEKAIGWFGAQRCCIGGDWPVSLLASSYTHTMQQYVDVIEKICTQEEAEQIFTQTVTAFYKL